MNSDREVAIILPGTSILKFSILQKFTRNVEIIIKTYSYMLMMLQKLHVWRKLDLVEKSSKWKRAGNCIYTHLNHPVGVGRITCFFGYDKNHTFPCLTLSLGFFVGGDASISDYMCPFQDSIPSRDILMYSSRRSNNLIEISSESITENNGNLLLIIVLPRGSIHMILLSQFSAFCC